MKHIDAWLLSNELISALKTWYLRIEDEEEYDQFTVSREYRNARLAYRRRINNSPDEETT